MERQGVMLGFPGRGASKVVQGLVVCKEDWGQLLRGRAKGYVEISKLS